MLKHSTVFAAALVLILITGTLALLHMLSGWWTVAVAAVYLALTVYGSANIRSNYFLQSFCRTNGPEKKIALTFDDGPCENTGRILDLLKQHQSRATFFFIGKNILQHPELVKRTHAEGHLIGNHSFSHAYHYDLLPTAKVLADIHRCDEAIAQLTGEKPTLFRPPYGVTNPNIAAALKTTGHTSVGWSLRTKDTVARSAHELITKVKQQVKTGDVVLFHDTQPLTTEALAQLLPWLSKQFQLVRVDELMKKDTGK